MELPVSIVLLIIGMAVVVVVLVALVAWQLGQIGWGIWTYSRDARRIDLGRKYDCELCTFTRKMHGWTGEIDYRGTRLLIEARDDGGVPDQQLICRVPAILSRLAELERLARAGVLEVTDKYTLDSVLSSVASDDDYEFALGFSYDEEYYGMSIYVHFKGEQVVGWMGVD
jgi:hypothetical protein